MSKLLDVIDKFKDVHVLVVGDVMLDKYIHGDVDRISPEAPIPVVKVCEKSSVLGGAANTALNMKKLGAKVSLCGVVGDDYSGTTLRSCVTDAGIDDGGLITVKNRHTTTKTRVIGRSQQIVRVDEEVIEDINYDAYVKLVTFCTNLNDIDAIVVSDYGKGVICADVMSYLLALKKTDIIELAVDPYVGNYSLYKGVTLITPNTNEALFYTKSFGMLTCTFSVIGEYIRSTVECDEVLITQGKDGMCFIGSVEKYIHIPTVAKDVFDVSGAGDTVIGVFSLARVARAQPKEAMQLSNIAAGIVVGDVGTSSIDIDRLRKGVIEFEKI